MFRSTPLALALHATLLGALLALATRATAQEPSWISIDGSPPGTPAEIQLTDGMSTEQKTSFDVRIHGFWQEDVLGEDGQTYQRLGFPGLTPMHSPGAPELPEARALLAVATDATDAVLVHSEVLTWQGYSNVKVYPAPIPGEDEPWDPTWDRGPGDTDGTPDKFSLDPTIYGSSGFWPTTAGKGGEVAPRFGKVAGASVAGWPVTWDPALKRLVVGTHVRYVFDHAGIAAGPLQITKLKAKQFTQGFLNWPELQPFYPAETVTYHSRYLIVAQPYWWDALEPFVKLKQAQGYEVSVDTALPDVGSIRNVIAAWYAHGDPGMDHFCLLVGDTLTIPQGEVLASGAVIPTDDVYGAIGTVNGSKEVHVGRLSIDGEADLTHQLQKIIDYQTSPLPGARYDTALLVSHEQGYPGKYAGSHSKVLNASYSHPPTFMVSFGGAGGTNTQVSNFITAGLLGDGLGLVAYRGHGSTRTWSGWNLVPEDWHSNNVIALTNPVHPVVWSIACTNANLGWGWGTLDDSLSEVWMEASDGAVASYGASVVTSTTPNHLLNELLFKIVYDAGVTTHAMAIDTAEAVVWTLWPYHKNPWAYLLLGDPSMTIRRNPAAELVVLNVPVTLTVEQAGEAFDIMAFGGAAGGPLNEGLLSFHKASFLHGEDDELAGALWMSPTTGATLELPSLTPGVIALIVRDQDGGVATRQIPVTMGPAWADLGHALGSPERTPAMAGLGSLEPGAPTSLLVTGGEPGATAWLCFGLAEFYAPLKGGVLVPDINPPGFVLPAPTDERGNLRIGFDWPTDAPSGVDLFMQTWFADDAGPVGFLATNGLLATTP